MSHALTLPPVAAAPAARNAAAGLDDRESAAARAGWPDDLTLLPTATLERRAGLLIRRYVHERRPALAQCVVRHIEALYLHPDSRDPAMLCGYRRLAAHWRWLAAQHAQAAAA